MKTLKKIKDAAIYKFGIISPVLHDSAMVQAQYFHQLWQKGVAIPPNSDNIYYFSPATFKAWLRKYKKYGLEGLKYKERKDKGVYKKITAAVKRAIGRIQRESTVVSVSDLYRKLLLNGDIKAGDICYETLRKYAKKHNLLARKKHKQRKKFQKQFINQLWMVDFKHGKSIRCGKSYRRTYLCAIIDDASRMVVGCEWGLNEDTALFARTLKKAIMVYGIPKVLYCDQGKVFKSNYIVQICARLGISLAHARPYSAESKGKIERFNRTVGQMFYPLIKDFSALSIEELNRQFTRFVNEIYHTRIHSTLGQPPLKKFQRQLAEVKINRLNQQQLEEFFLCCIKRRVRLDATVRIHKKDYQVTMKYVGENVEIRFPVDNPTKFYLFENDCMVMELKAINLGENASPPHVSTSYTQLSLWGQKEEKQHREG
jgi:putative transposase